MKVRTYPLLVESFKGDQSFQVVCTKCGAERLIGVDEINQEATFNCEGCGEWSAVFKYDEGEKCKGCGKLGFHADALHGCCSRRCQLQAEYAEKLGITA